MCVDVSEAPFIKFYPDSYQDYVFKKKQPKNNPNNPLICGKKKHKYEV